MTRICHKVLFVFDIAKLRKITVLFRYLRKASFVLKNA